MAGEQKNFPYSVEHGAIAMAYQNGKLIADEVLPRVPVGARNFTYVKRDIADLTTVPNSLVGRKSLPKEVEFGGTETPATIKDYALDDLVPDEDVESAIEGYDPLQGSIIGLTDLLLLDRERRVANLIMSPATYPAANVTTLSGTSQWSDYVNSDPILAIENRLDSAILRPNTVVMSRTGWSVFKNHPKVIQAVLGKATNNGENVLAQAVADRLEVEKVLIGEAFINTLNPNAAKTVNLARIWGKSCALLHLNRIVGANWKNQLTFGVTAQRGERRAGTMVEEKYEATRARVKEQVTELITADQLGFLLQNIIP
jgi:hypothetical protein